MTQEFPRISASPKQSMKVTSRRAAISESAAVR